MIVLSLHSLKVLRSSVKTTLLAFSDNLPQRLRLLVELVISWESEAVDEMFLLKMTAASDFTSDGYSPILISILS
jgi:hypothetical protein